MGALRNVKPRPDCLLPFGYPNFSPNDAAVLMLPPRQANEVHHYLTHLLGGDPFAAIERWKASGIVPWEDKTVGGKTAVSVCQKVELERHGPDLAEEIKAHAKSIGRPHALALMRKRHVVAFRQIQTELFTSEEDTLWPVHGHDGSVTTDRHVEPQTKDRVIEAKGSRAVSASLLP